MPTVSQLPAELIAECVAGNPFAISVTSTGATISSPVVTMRSDGDAYTTDPGIPTVSQAGAATSISFTAADTAALNTTTGLMLYQWSLQALVNGEGPFELVAKTIRIYPIGSAAASSSTSATLAVTVGGAVVSLAVTLGGGGVMSAAQILTAIKTVDGPGSGLDADLLDGISAAGFDAAGTAAAAVATHAGLGDPHPGYMTPAEGSAAYDALGAAAAAQAAAIAASQPVDADLTAIAALTTTAYGRALLALADAAALTAAINIATETLRGSVEFATNAETVTGSSTSLATHPAGVAAAIAALIDAAPGTLDTLNELAAALGDDPNFAATMATALGNKQPLDSDLTAIAALTTTAYGRAFLALADAAAGRTALGLGTAATTAAADYATAAQGATADAAVPKSLYDANSILIATADNTPIALPVAASTFVGRKASGDIDDMTPTEARALLNVGASTGWAVSNVTTDKVFDANATSIDELADVLGTLIAWHISRGDITA